MTDQLIANPAANVASIYERQCAIECADLTKFYEGSLNALFCVISSIQPTEREQKALEATAQRGSFASQQMIWVTTNVSREGASESSNTTLDSADLMRLVEAVDPLCLVVLDQRAAEALSRAYNQPVKLEACDSILGRPCCAFVDFARTLQTDERKQRAWALFKELLAHVNDL
jgi:hypothetical protein